MTDKVYESADDLPTQEYDDAAMPFEPGVPVEAEEDDESPDEGEGDEAS